MSFDGLLNRRCDIEVKTITQDASGQRQGSWKGVFLGIKCRLDPKGGDVVFGPTKVFEKATHILFMRKPLTLTITTKNHRISLEGQKYSILLVQEVYGSRTISHLNILLEQIK